jgi:hypothetical protein
VTQYETLVQVQQQPTTVNRYFASISGAARGRGRIFLQRVMSDAHPTAVRERAPFCAQAGLNAARHCTHVLHCTNSAKLEGIDAIFRPPPRHDQCRSYFLPNSFMST